MVNGRYNFLVGLVGLNLWDRLTSVVTMPHLAHWQQVRNVLKVEQKNKEVEGKMKGFCHISKN